MTTRRGRGEGTIRLRDDGRWQGAVLLGGKRKYVYGKTRAEVSRKVADLRRDHDAGMLVGDARQTVGQWLDAWLATKRHEVKDWTWHNYTTQLTRHVRPLIGAVKLSALRGPHVQRVVAEMHARGLSASYIGVVFGTLRQALKSAVRLGLLARDPSDVVSRPRKRQREMTVLAPQEARRLLEVAHTGSGRDGGGGGGDRLEALWHVALGTGMRRGELMALRWRDVDLERGRIAVVASLYVRAGEFIYSQPKTRRSRRQIALAPGLVNVLRDHRQRQRLERLGMGAAWQGDRYDAVFADEIGYPLTQHVMANMLTRLLRVAGLPHIRFHDLRHTCATLLLGQGVNPKIVSEMLGHSSIALTLDTYSHVLPDMQQDAARAIGVALGY